MTETSSVGVEASERSAEADLEGTVLKNPLLYRGPAILVGNADVSLRELSYVDPAISLVSTQSTDGKPTFLLRSRSCATTVMEIASTSFDFIAAVWAGDEGRRELAAAVDYLQQEMDLNLDVVELGDVDIARRLSGAIQQGLAGLVVDLARRNASLGLALSEVRRELEHTQDAFVALEEAASQLQSHRKLVFYADPIGRELGPFEGHLTQTLPRSSRALVAIELFFFNDEPASEGQYQICLEAVEDGRVVSDWTLRFADISTGWVSLELATAMRGPARSLALRISASSATAYRPRIGLAPPMIQADAPYELETGERGDRPLAMRLWCGLPGGRAGYAAGQVARPHSADLTRSLALGPVQLGTVEAHGKDKTKSAKLVQFIADANEIQVHPRRGGIVFARIPNAMPKGVVKVAAKIATRHEAAPAIDYAMLLPGQANWLGKLLPRLAVWGVAQYFEGFSGWTSINPGQIGTVTLSLSKSLSAPSDLILMTRPANPKGGTDYGWARFFEIEAEFEAGGP